MSSEASRESVLAKIRAIVGDVIGNPAIEITEKTTAADVAGWDSLSHVQIVMSVERAFGIRLKAVEVAQLEGVGSLVGLVVARMAG